MKITNCFEIDEKNKFDPSKLDHDNPDKAKITEVVIKMLKKMTELSNANLVKNVDGLLSKRSADTDIEWIVSEKKMLPENRYKISY